MSETTPSNIPDELSKQNRCRSIIDKIFFDRYTPGLTTIEFKQIDIKNTVIFLEIGLPDNLGDIIYHFRFRGSFSTRMLRTQPDGLAWRIELAGRSLYRFVLGKESRIVPSATLVKTDIPDATPEIIASYALDDEQALLAIVRYNRLIDTFLSVTTYSLQNHLRTTVKKIGQIEIDELYVGIDSQGKHYVVPVQAKGGKDQISVVQTTQDMRACEEKFVGVRCRPVSVQFMPDKTIAMFELTLQDGELRVVGERHYRLVAGDRPRGPKVQKRAN